MREFDKHSFLREVLVGLRDAVPHPRRVASRSQHENKNQDQEIFQSCLTTPIVRISLLFRRFPSPIEVLFQNNGGSHRIYGRSFRRFLPFLADSVDEPSLRFFEQTLRLP